MGVMVTNRFSIKLNQSRVLILSLLGRGEDEQCHLLPRIAAVEDQPVGPLFCRTGWYTVQPYTNQLLHRLNFYYTNRLDRISAVPVGLQTNYTLAELV